MINVWDVLSLILCCVLLRVAGIYIVMNWIASRPEPRPQAQPERKSRLSTTNPVVAALALILAIALAVVIWLHVTHTRKHQPAKAAAQAHVQTPEEAATAKLQQEAASKGLMMLQMLAPQEQDLMGFPTQQAIAQTKLEQPFDVCDGYLDKLAAFQPGTNPDSVMACGAEQIYPASSQGTIYIEMMITRQTTGWQAGQWASPRRIRQLSTWRTSLAQKESRLQSDYYVLDIMAMHQTFMAQGKGTEMVLYPIEDSPALALKAGQALPAADLLMKLQPAARHLADSSNKAPGN